MIDNHVSDNIVYGTKIDILWLHIYRSNTNRDSYRYFCKTHGYEIRYRL